uniref:Putative ovule protein n=1 Tax=Solanum chacoense TaxID=4108 RepID=A0A0V0HAB8_SOLCH
MRQNLQIVVLTFIVIVLSSFQSNCRELRPAEHGLTTTENQNSDSTTTTTNDEVPEMMSFFGGNDGRRNTQPPVAKPIAENVTWIGGERGGMSVHHNSRDHVRDVLLISSLVCGATGVVLLAVSVFVCVVLRFRKEKSVENGKETTSLATPVDNVVLAQKGT